MSTYLHIILHIIVDLYIVALYSVLQTLLYVQLKFTVNTICWMYLRSLLRCCCVSTMYTAMLLYSYPIVAARIDLLYPLYQSQGWLVGLLSVPWCPNVSQQQMAGHAQSQVNMARNRVLKLFSIWWVLWKGILGGIWRRWVFVLDPPLWRRTDGFVSGLCLKMRPTCQLPSN